ncbi:MAG TPA: cation-translocating P-type ATPase [Candidatus Obscuribacterales bacterium]
MSKASSPTPAGVGTPSSCCAHEEHRPHGLDLMRIAVVGVVFLLSWLELVGSFYVATIGTIAVVVCGYPIYKHAFSALAKRRMTMELSMTIALVAAIAISEFVTALIIVFFVLVAEELEKLTVRQGRASIRTLLDLLPRTAFVLKDGTLKEVPLAYIAAGNIVTARPGSRIVVDGVVVGGHSFVDESAITGESMPVEKQSGSRVYAGTINLSGALDIRAEQIGQDTAFGKIVVAVEEAEKSRAHVERVADRLASYLVYFAFAGAAITLLVTGSVTDAIAVIIVAGACGVAAGTPLANLGAIGRAAQRGTIIKGGLPLERLGVVDTVVFDKTGTLTVGTPRVVSILPRFGVTPEEVLGAAAVAESLSEHPLGEAIVRASQEASLTVERPERFQYVPGRGIISRSRHDEIVVGNRELLDERGIKETDNHQPCKHLSEVLVARNGRLLGRIHVADSLRPESKAVISALKDLGIKTFLMTGDTEAIGRKVAHELGVDEYAANLRPDDKRKRVADLVAQGRKVAMVGDGINDAPALAEATVGVAIGSGTDVAIESASVVVIGNDLTRFVDAVKIARQAKLIIATNFVGTIVVDALGMVLAFMGMLNPLVAAFIHVGSEVFFLANSARLFPSFSFRKAGGDNFQSKGD